LRGGLGGGIFDRRAAGGAAIGVIGVLGAAAGAERGDDLSFANDAVKCALRGSTVYSEIAGGGKHKLPIGMVARSPLLSFRFGPAVTYA
jgi:hypothetical protein